VGTAGVGEGGAIFVRNGTLSATFLTLTGNTAAQGGTDLAVLGDGSGSQATVSLKNSILGQDAATTVTDFFSTTNGSGTAASYTTSTNNLVTLNGTGANGLPGDALVAGTSPNFAVAGLTDNGGPTPTVALTAASTSALDAGVSGTGVTTDQRGVARANTPDLGAFEYTQAGPTISGVSPNQGSSTGGTAITITGTGFVSGATVTVGGVAATNVVVVSATSITATTPAGTVGAADLVVTNPDTTTITDAGAFTYLQSQANLSGHLFVDFNADAVQDPGETGIVGRTVFLDANGNGVLDNGEPSALTGADGAYSFTGIAPGTYTLSLQTLGFESGVGVNGTGTTLVLSAGEDLSGVGLGERLRSAVGPLPVDSQVFAGTYPDANTALVEGYYQAILGRAADTVGLAFWTSALQTTSPQEVIRGIVDSDESRSNQVRDDYRVILGRTASADEVAGWVDAMKAGLSSSEVATAFLTSPEYTAETVSNQAFVSSLYRIMLSREGEEGGLAFWTNALDSGATRAEIVAGFFDSTESRDLAIDALYSELLERPVDVVGQAIFQPLASTGTGNDTLIETILSSPEFTQRRTAVG
jgi:hypothetical protein